MKSRLYIIAVLIITTIINFPLPAQAAGFPVTLTEVIEATTKLKSYEHTSKIGMNLTVQTGSVSEKINYVVNATGKVIQAKSPSYSYVFDLFMDGVLDNEYFSVNAGIDAVFLKKTLYLNLKRLAFTSNEFTDEDMDAIDEQLKGIKNVWIKIKLSELLEYAEEDGIAALTSSDDISDVLKGIEGLQQLNIVTFNRQTQESTINGKLTRRYTLTFDKAALLKLIETETTLTPAEKMETRDIFNSFTISSFDVWIDEASMLPMKISGNVTLNDFEVDQYEQYDATITLESTLGKINSVKKIKAPKKAKSLESFLELLF